MPTCLRALTWPDRLFVLVFGITAGVAVGALVFENVSVTHFWVSDGNWEGFQVEAFGYIVRQSVYPAGSGVTAAELVWGCLAVVVPFAGAVATAAGAVSALATPRRPLTPQAADYDDRIAAEPVPAADSRRPSGSNGEPALGRRGRLSGLFSDGAALRRWRAYWLTGGAAVLAMLAAVGVYLVGADPAGPGVQWDNVRRIEVGMTRPEVEAVIGSPPQSVRPADPLRQVPPGVRTSLMWSGAECDIWVHLDQDGRVIGREGVGGRLPTWYDRLRRRLGV